MKRKASDSPNGDSAVSCRKRTKASLTTEEVHKRFRRGLFDEATLEAYRSSYARSTPYRHAVISDLVDDGLLRAVRDEIRANVHFSPKETDIYRIHQSGDLANLDGLDDASLARLPSLLALRDAIYSRPFRDYVAAVTGCGALSGRKTDMAVNVYTPGCYLLCHDDVIGSRRVSYILYLTDPDRPWRPEWGGALRLFPVEEKKSGASAAGGEGGDGSAVARTPLPDPVRSIPPAWNQLSFFAVQPGESFHDVEEVHHPDEEELKDGDDGGRVRMAISGWFHIPQPGEDGFVEGEEERNARNSSLAQLRGNPAQYDEPQPRPVPVPVAATASRDRTAAEFDEADLEFLLQYISPTYLTPDTLEQVSEHFLERSVITLPDFLSRSFAARLRTYIEEQESGGSSNKKQAGKDGEMEEGVPTPPPWRVARPPHKHRYLYQQPARADELRATAGGESSPLTELIDYLFPSRAFRAWLEVAARAGRVVSHDLVARRFRAGRDYTLATGHEGAARVEMNLCVTPSGGWGGEEGGVACGDGDGDESEEEEEESEDEGKGKEVVEPEADEKGKGKEVVEPEADEKGKGKEVVEPEADEKGKDKEKAKSGPEFKGKGKEKMEAEAAAVATDNSDDKEPDGGDDDSDDIDVGGQEVYMADDDNEADDDDGKDDADEAAVYRAGDADGDNILFHQTASWNRLTLVMRDGGTLKFTKYVSRRARGDRWDVCGVFEVEDEEGRAGGPDEGAKKEEDEEGGVALGESDLERTFNGFSASSDDESD